MNFTEFSNQKRYIRGENSYSLYFDFDLKDLTKHNRKTFDDCQSLLYFLQNNPEKQIYLTQTKTDDFYEEDNKLVINIKNYQEFCKKIGQNGKNRTQAFLAQKIERYSEEIRDIVIANASEQEILNRINNFTDEQKNKFIEKLEYVANIKLSKTEDKEINNDDFIKAFSTVLNDPQKKGLITDYYSQIQVNILEEYIELLKDNLNQNETFIQNWIDGKIDNLGNCINCSNDEILKIKKSRCLIFGLEFISHKREGIISSKKFDILTRISQGKNDYVLIELKSPNSDIFQTSNKVNKNQGVSVEYSLSDDTSRAIPQISDYRNLLENATDIEWQKIGLSKGKVSKCLIVIGTKKDDPVWLDHFLNLRKNLSSTIEILTYTDLIQKLEITVKNLKDNL